MEKQTNEERNEAPEGRSLKDMSNEELQEGIDANIAKALNDFVSRLKLLEEMTGRKISVKTNAKMYDGRKIHVNVR